MDDWVKVIDSPVVVNERLARREFEEVYIPADFDLYAYFRWDTAPIEIVRTALAEHSRHTGLPDTKFLGEDFERAVYRDFYKIYENRNRQSGLDYIAAAAKFAYTIQWFSSSDTSASPDSYEGLPTNLWVQNFNLCVSVQPGVNDDAEYIRQVTNWIKWVIPHFPNSTVSVCDYDIVDISVHTYAGVLDMQDVTLEE